MNKSLILSLVGALLLGLALGRATLPAKVVTKTVEVEKKALESHADKTDHSTTTVTETKRPDGTITKVTEIKKDVDTVTDKKLKEESKSETSKEVIRETARWSMNGLAVTDLFHPPASIRYGAQIEYRLFGPFRTGILGFADGTVGVSLGIQF